MSYAIPTNELTLTDRKNYVNAAIRAGIDRALKLEIARVEDELVVREANPNVDLASAVALGYLFNHYTTATPLPALAWVSVFDSVAAINYPQLTTNRIAVFYKVAENVAPPISTGVRFLVGATGATTKAMFFYEVGIDNKLESDFYFSEPVVYDPLDTLFIQFYPRVAMGLPGGLELSFGCFIVERTGGTVS